MNPRHLFAASVLALSAASAAVFAAPTGEAPDSDRGDAPREHRHHRHHGGGMFSVERAAMHNILIEKLAQQTGKSSADVAAAMKDRHPREIGAALGLDDETMHSTFQAARTTLIQRAAEAQLITAEQAEELRKAPKPGRFGGRRGDEDRPEQES